jgi:predicted SprT family Zn-dependent metalloprotease
MDLGDARKLAVELIAQYKLDGWSFSFDNAKKRHGLCHYSKKTIFLSKISTSNRTNEEVKNTILHEIAHALTPGEHHNKVWKRKFIEIGGTGERCSKCEYKAKGKNMYICTNCGHNTETHRKWIVPHACYVCCKIHNNGKYDPRFKMEKIR